jgi:hypothetical protein
MSYQSPNISKIAKATPLPDSPAEDKPHEEYDNHNSSPKATTTTTQPSSSADFAQSEKTANIKTHLCLRFKNVANNYLESSTFQQRSEGAHPSEEGRENAQEQKRQWTQDILGDVGETGLNEVVKISFLREAEGELHRLEGFAQAEATKSARVAWERVLDLIAECRAGRTDVDRTMEWLA